MLSLSETDPNGNVFPELAAEIPTIENGGVVVDEDACHQIQVRRSGGGWSVSMHCSLPGELPLVEAHRISTKLEARLREGIDSLERVIIHTEPREEGA